jgi:inosine/xanthosine triphosphatase
MTDLVAVASQNPVKLEATRRAFARMFPDSSFEVRAVTVDSGVRPQPRSDAEALEGAMQRASRVAQDVDRAAYCVGIEGGVDVLDEELFAFAWVVVRAGNQVGRARTGAFPLPDAVRRRIQGGEELGHANDVVFGQTNSKQRGGAIGLLTGNVVDRTALYEQAVILSLVRFRNTGLFERADQRV